MKYAVFLILLSTAMCLAGTTATRGGGYPAYKLGDTAIVTVTTSPILANAPVYRFRYLNGQPDGAQPTQIGVTNSLGVFIASAVLTTGVGWYTNERFAVGSPTNPTSSSMSFSIETPAPTVTRNPSPYYYGDTVTLDIRTSPVLANIPIYRWLYFNGQEVGPQPTKIGTTDGMGRFLSSVVITTGAGQYTLESFAVGSQTGFKSPATAFTIYPARQAPTVSRQSPAPNYRIGDVANINLSTNPPQPLAPVYRYRLFNGQPDGAQPTQVSTTDSQGRWNSSVTINSGIGTYADEQWTVGSPTGLRSPKYNFTIAAALPQAPIVSRAAPYPVYRIGDTMRLTLSTSPSQPNQTVYHWYSYYGTTTGPVTIGTTDASGMFQWSVAVTSSMGLGSYANEQFAVGSSSNPRSAALNYQIQPALNSPIADRASPYPDYFLGDIETLVISTDPPQPYEPVYRYRYKDGLPDGDQPTRIGTTDGSGSYSSRTTITSGFGEYTGESFAVGDPNGLRSWPMSFTIIDDNPVPLEVNNVVTRVLEAGTKTRVRLHGNGFTENTTVAIATQAANKTVLKAVPIVTVEGVSIDGTEMVVEVDTLSSLLTEPFYNFEVRDGEKVTGSPFRLLPPGPVVDGYSPAVVAGGKRFAFTINGAHLSSAAVNLSDPSIGKVTIVQAEDSNIFGFIDISPVSSTKYFNYLVTFNNQTIVLPAVVGTQLASSAIDITTDTNEPTNDAKTGPAVPPIYFEPITLSDSLKNYRAYGKAPKAKDLSICTSINFRWLAVFRAAHTLIPFDNTGRIGQISSVLGVGQSIDLNAMVVSLAGAIVLDIGWEYCVGESVSIPYVCYEFTIATQIPGRSQTITTSDCYGGVVGETMPPARKNPRFDVQGGACGSISNKSISAGVGTARVTQTACCEQPIIIDMRCNDAWHNVWECFEFRRVVGSTLPNCTPPTPVGITRIEYLEPGGNWTPINGNINVLMGTEVQFRAVKNTSTAWPQGQPVWTGLDIVTTGETASSTFTSQGVRAIQVSSGTSTQQFTVTTYDITLQSTPSDDFPGRSQTDFGLKESVKLTFSTTTASVAPSSLKYAWRNDENTGSANDSDYTHTFGLSPKTVKFTLTLDAGPSKNQTRSISLKLIAPTRGRLFIMPCAGMYHDFGLASAGFIGLTNILPSTVTFPGLEFREGGGITSGTGYFQNVAIVHQPTPHLSIGKRSPKYGNYFGYDRVEDAWVGPYSDGVSRWPIDWQYQVSPGQFITFTQVNHDTQIRADGSITTSKGGPAVPFQLNDPSSVINSSCLGDPPP